MENSSSFIDALDYIRHSAITPSLIAGGLSLIGGLVAAWWSATGGRRFQDSREISEAVRTNAMEAELRVKEAILNKLPSGMSKEELEGLLGQQIRIGGDLIIGQKASADRQLVEDLVTNYHQQALSQARVQFWFSVMAATIGFLYIMYAASTADSSNPATYTKILPGVVIEAVAALFFRQAEQTRQRATELYDRLRKGRQMVRAESVVETIEDIRIRSAVKAQIALHMVGLVPKEIDLQSFLSKVATTESPDGQPESVKVIRRRVGYCRDRGRRQGARRDCSYELLDGKKPMLSIKSRGTGRRRYAETHFPVWR
jgi:hypothetical protein